MKIRVLETGEFEFKGERFTVPVKVEISGREYIAKREMEYSPYGDVHGLTIEELKDLRLGDIPEFLSLICENTELGWLMFAHCFASLAVLAKPRRWRGKVSMDYYFDCLALKSGFKLVKYSSVGDIEEDDYHIEFGKRFPEDTTVEEVYEVFQKLVDKVSTFEKIADTLITALASIGGKFLEVKV